MKHAIKIMLFSASTLLLTQPSYAQDTESVWVTIDPVAAKHYKQVQNSLKPNDELLSIQDTTLQTVNLLKIRPANIAHLSEFMHDNYHRCGGFVAHDSLIEANEYTQQLASVQNQNLSALAATYSINNPQTTQQLINSISPNNLTNTVNSMSSFYNRYYTAQTGVDASQWLKDYWQQLAATRNDINVDYFTHSWAQSSVIVTIAGDEEADEIVIIGGHLDSINQSNPSNG